MYGTLAAQLDMFVNFTTEIVREAGWATKVRASWKKKSFPCWNRTVPEWELKGQIVPSQKEGKRAGTTPSVQQNYIAAHNIASLSDYFYTHFVTKTGLISECSTSHQNHWNINWYCNTSTPFSKLFNKLCTTNTWRFNSTFRNWCSHVFIIRVIEKTLTAFKRFSK